MLLILLSGCSGIVTEVGERVYTVDEFDFKVERADYNLNITGPYELPDHLCPVVKVKVPLYIYHVSDDTVCYKCKDEKKSILVGWVENNATVCVIK